MNRQPYWEFMRAGFTPQEQSNGNPKDPLKEAWKEIEKTESTWGVYVAGSLRNPAIPSVAQELSELSGKSVFCDWFAAGPEADDHWKAFYKDLGFSYRQALDEPASVNTYNFDKKHMDESANMVLVLPAGKSGHLELGYFLGCGKPGYILLDGNDTRWDVMYQFATGVTDSIEELAEWLMKWD